MLFLAMLSAARLCRLAPESSFLGLSKRELSLLPNFLDFDASHLDSTLTVSPLSSSQTLSLSEAPFFFRLPRRFLPRLFRDELEPLLDKSPSSWNSVTRLLVEFSLLNFLILSFIVTVMDNNADDLLSPLLECFDSSLLDVVSSQLNLFSAKCPGCFVFSSHCSSLGHTHTALTLAHTDITAAHFTHEETIYLISTPLSTYFIQLTSL